MSNEIEYAYPTGNTLYAVIINNSAQIWTGSAFAAPTSGWHSSAALSELGTTGLYAASFPTGITTAGIYNVVVYKQVGGTPASTDTIVATGGIDWDGTAEMNLSDPHFRRLLRYVDGKYTYNPATGVLSLYALDGTTVAMTATLTHDASGNITQRVTS